MEFGRHAIHNEGRGHYDLNPEPGLERFLAELNLGVVAEDGTITGPDTGAATAGRLDFGLPCRSALGSPV
jgi:hypothetical protein